MFQIICLFNTFVDSLGNGTCTVYSITLFPRIITLLSNFSTTSNNIFNSSCDKFGLFVAVATIGLLFAPGT